MNDISNTITVTKTKKSITNEDYFNNIDTPNKAYSLGLLMSDGSISRNHSISISQKVENSDILNYLCEELGFVGYYNLGIGKSKSKIKYGRDKYYPCINFTNKRLSKSLQKLGMIPSKTHKCRLPVLSEELMPYLILGWFDGDGCIHISKQKNNNSYNTVFQISGTMKSMLDIYYYLNKRGIEVKYRHHNKNSNCYIVYCYKKESIKQLYDLFYNNNNNRLGLIRKKKVFEEILDKFNYIGTSETWFDNKNDFISNKYIKNKHVFNSCIIGMALGNASVMSASRFRIHKGRSSMDNSILKAKVKMLESYIQPVRYIEGKYAHYRSKKRFKYIYDSMVSSKTNNNKYLLPDNIIHRINDWVLFFMYLDKGRIDIKDSNCVIINMKNYTKHDCTKLSNYLNKRYSLDISVLKYSGNISIRLCRESLLELIREPLAVFNTVLDDIVKP